MDSAFDSGDPKNDDNTQISKYNMKNTMVCSCYYSRPRPIREIKRTNKKNLQNHSTSDLRGSWITITVLSLLLYSPFAHWTVKMPVTEAIG